MALTPSNMLELGLKAPDFQLRDVVTNQEVSLMDVRGFRGTFVMFICQHCPYVIHIEEEMTRVAHEYMDKGIGAVAISSNDIEKYPDDSPEKMIEQAKRNGFRFPYLYDEDQSVAHAYDAACTPDFYLFDADDLLVYRGRLDESRPGNEKPVDGHDLRTAMDCLISGGQMPIVQYPSMGCNIKWKS